MKHSAFSPRTVAFIVRMFCRPQMLWGIFLIPKLYRLAQICLGVAVVVNLALLYFFNCSAKIAVESILRLMALFAAFYILLLLRRLFTRICDNGRPPIISYAGQKPLFISRVPYSVRRGIFIAVLVYVSIELGNGLFYLIANFNEYMRTDVDRITFVLNVLNLFAGALLFAGCVRTLTDVSAIIITQRNSTLQMLRDGSIAPEQIPVFNPATEQPPNARKILAVGLAAFCVVLLPFIPWHCGSLLWYLPLLLLYARICCGTRTFLRPWMVYSYAGLALGIGMALTVSALFPQCVGVFREPLAPQQYITVILLHFAQCVFAWFIAILLFECAYIVCGKKSSAQQIVVSS